MLWPSTVLLSFMPSQLSIMQSGSNTVLRSALEVGYAWSVLFCQYPHPGCLPNYLEQILQIIKFKFCMPDASLAL